MEANLLPQFHSKPSSFLLINQPFTTQISLLRPTLRPSLKATPTSNNSIEDGNTVPAATPSPVTPLSETVEIRFRRGSRKRSKQKQQENISGESRKPPPPPKEWDSMTLGEKALELYVGEKGLLFWLNKFAYASIFIIIGAWILFRFVGPSLGLYQLDTPPLTPTDVLKG